MQMVPKDAEKKWDTDVLVKKSINYDFFPAR